MSSRPSHLHNLVDAVWWLKAVGIVSVGSSICIIEVFSIQDITLCTRVRRTQLVLLFDLLKDIFQYLSYRNWTIITEKEWGGEQPSWGCHSALFLLSSLLTCSRLALSPPLTLNTLEGSTRCVEMYFHRYTHCRKLSLLGQFGFSLPGGDQQTASSPHLPVHMNGRCFVVVVCCCLIIIVWLCWNLFAKDKWVKKIFLPRTRLSANYNSGAPFRNGEMGNLRDGPFLALNSLFLILLVFTEISIYCLDRSCCLYARVKSFGCSLRWFLSRCRSEVCKLILNFVLWVSHTLKISF